MTVKRISLADNNNDLNSMQPKLRTGLEPIAFQDAKGNTFFGLRDHLKLSENELWFAQDLFYLLQYFDGKHSCQDIRAEYVRQYKNFLYIDRFKEFLQSLDDSLLFENQKSKQAIRNLAQAYRKQTLRKPACAGQSYPDDPKECHAFLEKMLRIEVPPSALVEPSRDIKAVIAPHIDLRLGGAAFAQTYFQLAKNPAADLYVVLGIGHNGLENAFALSGKSFETPIGRVNCDRELAKNLAESCPFDLFADELAHRDEHSIEFQTLFLKHIVKSDFTILPILCSFSPFELEIEGETREQFVSFTSNLKELLQSYQGKVCVVASVDFAHVGPRYSSNSPVTKTSLARVEKNDLDVIQKLSHFEIKSFQEIFISNMDQFNICGYSALRTLLAILDPCDGILLNYDHAIMDDHRSTVTFASMIFVSR